MTAIYYQDKTISYKKLLMLIEKCEIQDPVFPVTKTFDCVIKVLTCLIKGIPFFPYSPHLHERPNIEIPQDCDFILHTSGSSKMKYALFTKETLIQSNMNTHEAFILKPSDVYLLNLPLYHIAALSLLMRAFLRGAAIAIEPADQNIITHISMVPAMTDQLLKKRLYPNLKALLLGGNFISEDLANKLVDLNYPLYVTYGMTEMSSHVFVSKYQKENGVCFERPLRNRKLYFEDGILYVKGCGKFIRYFDTNETEFHNTKDIVNYEHKVYRIKARQDGMFISGGENIYPEEIKQSLLKHPSVLKVNIEIRPHLKWGKRPFVTLYTCTDISKESIQEFLSDKLEKFKIPKKHELQMFSIQT
ncbi:MAG: 2-succinylbenzoate--CoA ligase [Chlamydiia bacterium]|nr:2-succinylbenzoate--CoA ligase [Chlamydiia bacterium]